MNFKEFPHSYLGENISVTYISMNTFQRSFFQGTLGTYAWYSWYLLFLLWHEMLNISYLLGIHDAIDSDQKAIGRHSSLFSIGYRLPPNSIMSTKLLHASSKYTSYSKSILWAGKIKQRPVIITRQVTAIMLYLLGSKTLHFYILDFIRLGCITKLICTLTLVVPFLKSENLLLNWCFHYYPWNLKVDEIRHLLIWKWEESK